jgi:hypothetical protein
MPRLEGRSVSLTPLSTQTPLVWPVVSSPIAFSQPSLNLPSLPKPNLDLRLKECERKPDIVGGLVADALGRPHKWLIVEDPFGNTIHAPGLGNKLGVPGANGQASPDWPLSKTFIRDHGTEVPRSCKALPAVDPLCVIQKTPYKQYEGRWVPFTNDCNSFSQRTINACQVPNLWASPLNSLKSPTVWDKVSLLPKPDATAKYMLLDADLLKSAKVPAMPQSNAPKTKSR